MVIAGDTGHVEAAAPTPPALPPIPPATPNLLEEPEMEPVGGPHWRSLCGVHGAIFTCPLGHLEKGRRSRLRGWGSPQHPETPSPRPPSSPGAALLAHLAGVVRGAEGAVPAGALRVPGGTAGTQLHLVCG